jgi:hypothetical protein
MTYKKDKGVYYRTFVLYVVSSTDILFNKSFYFSLVPENMNSKEETSSRDKVVEISIRLNA